MFPCGRDRYERGNLNRRFPDIKKIWSCMQRGLGQTATRKHLGGGESRRECRGLVGGERRKHAEEGETRQHSLRGSQRIGS